MATKGLETLYNWAKSTGYERSIDDFYNLISTNKDAFNRVYGYAKETGYERDENAFAGLIGLQEAAQQEMPATETAQSQQQTAYQSDINRSLMPMTEGTTVRELEPEEPGQGKPKVKYGKKQDVIIKEGEEERTISTDSPEYRKAYEEGRVMNLDEEGMPYRESTKPVEVIESKPTWIKDKEKMSKVIPALKDIPNDVYYETIVKPFKSDIDAVREDTTKELLDIYSSEGYSNKLRNELEKSGVTDKKVQDVLLNRVVRLITTPIEYENLKEGERGQMTAKTSKDESNPFSPYLSSTDIKLSSELKKGNLENKKSTSIEEYEHASHISPKINIKEEEKSYNITPYAKQINKKYNKSDTEYLRDDTEAIAKKRATEVYLINKGLLSPGGFADDSHYDYLLANYDNLPKNVKQFLMITTGDKTNFGELSNKAKLKLEEEKYNKSSKNKIEVHSKEFNKQTQDFKKSFKAFMNEIAMNDRQQETAKTTG